MKLPSLFLNSFNPMKTLRRNFQRFLESGAFCTPPGRAACALSHAKTLEEWEKAESEGRVKIEAEPSVENYFDVYGEPEGYTDIHGRKVSTDEERKQIEESIERDGNWCVVTYWHDGDRWQVADSVGQCIYSNPCDPFQNCYVPGLMRSALDCLAMAGAV